jgi:transketolase
VRTAFIEQLCHLAKEDERVWLLTGDLGYSVLEPFADTFPKRFLNAGVAEQNMMGLAAGLAMRDKVVFVYSIANFPVMRCLEQIRNDICYHNLDVKVVAVGGGLAYGSHGYTHHAVEDLAVMSAMPNMKVVAPGDPMEARAATSAIAAAAGPAYLRLGKAGEPMLHQSQIDFKLGRAIQLQGGDDFTIISTGGMLATAVEATAELTLRGYSIRLLSMHTLAPLDAEAIRRAAYETSGILTIEEHGVGGLATRTAEVLAMSGAGTPFIPLRLGSDPIRLAGSQVELRSLQGLCVSGILSAIDSLEQLVQRQSSGQLPDIFSAKQNYRTLEIR